MPPKLLAIQKQYSKEVMLDREQWRLLSVMKSMVAKRIIIEKIKG
jgi:hypothetical protein